METQTYECKDYNIRLYETNKDIILLDIFINNKEKFIIKLSSCADNIIIYGKYKIVYKYYKEHWKLGYDCDEIEKKAESIKIKLNKIFPILEDYHAYNGSCDKNLISVTFIRKDLLKEFTAQIDENIILKTLKFIL